MNLMAKIESFLEVIPTRIYDLTCAINELAEAQKKSTVTPVSVPHSPLEKRVRLTCCVCRNTREVTDKRYRELKYDKIRKGGDPEKMTCSPSCRSKLGSITKHNKLILAASKSGIQLGT